MKEKSKVSVLFSLIGVVKPLTGFMILAIIMGTAGFLCAQFIPVFGALAVVHGLGYEIPIHINAVWILLIAFALVRAFLRFAEQRTNHYIAFTLLAIIRDKVFKALRKLCPAKLEGKDKGDLISLITSDVELLEVFYAHTISPICIAILTEIIMCIFIGSFHWSMGLLAAIAFLCVGVLLPLIISKRSGTLGDKLRSGSGDMAAYMLENIRGLDDTLQYGLGNSRMESMNHRTENLSKEQGKLNRLTGINAAIANCMILAADLCMLILGVLLYRNGIVTFDRFLIPLIALMSSFGPVTALANLGTTLQSTIASGARVLEILNEQPETEDISGRDGVGFDGAGFENVDFSYGGDNVLQDFTVAVPKGAITGVLGKSGSGKSTMLKLLMRFWDADAGRVTIFGRDIKEINTTDLRNMESYMTQSTVLFKDTIENNIRIGKLDASHEEVEAACRKAALHEFIMTLPEGYETQVGELGETLSGGERQRIALARAFLHGAEFMLLDEPTSNLDSLNEAVVLRSLKDEGAGKTIVLVSHRESTLRIADNLIRVESGRLS